MATGRILLPVIQKRDVTLYKYDPTNPGQGVASQPLAFLFALWNLT
ncbi:MAG TPA: hypothetical protein VFF50_07895 [Candidatus Deferrimicrobiaceae bacterium]|nr:hypothetical protein [Candidatus Deferrimicrobiaceae bacterium]